MLGSSLIPADKHIHDRERILLCALGSRLTDHFF